jgi:thioredoxin 1
MNGRKAIFYTLNDMNFQQEVLENQQPVLVLFGAEWSGSCNILAPIIESLADDFKGQIKFGRIDIDHNNRTAKEYEIRNLPTIILFKNGRMVDYLIGMISRRLLASKLEALSDEDQLKK